MGEKKNTEPDRLKGTRKLEAEDGSVVLPILGLAYGANLGTLYGAVEYVPLPKPPRRRGAGSLRQPWRVVLTHPNPSLDVIGLAVYGDVVLGRAEEDGGEMPDLDLTCYGALEHGVSRRHAMLRPTTTQLFLIDLGSTNGTQVNATPLGAGMARALKHDDTLTLGDLYLTLKIVSTPTAANSKDK